MDWPSIPKVQVGLLGADYTVENGPYRFVKLGKRIQRADRRCDGFVERPARATRLPPAAIFSE
jgi:hypothetical protein